MPNYRPYPAYQPSGIDWLGDIPTGWKASRIKFFSEINPSKSQVRSLAKDTLVSFIPMEAIGDDGTLNTENHKTIDEVINGYTFVAENDLMLAKITPCFENGKAAIAKGLKNEIGFATTEVIPLRCKNSNDAIFLYYLLHSAPFKNIAEGSMYGAGGQKRVADNFIANYHFALPDINEREKIAAFLDRETAKIDQLIAKQQQLIELLKEKRQAVISHAVTKGLNPDVKMKPSGVEWLGDVPEHWTIIRIKFIAEVNPSKAEVRNLKSDTLVSFIPMEAIGENGSLDISQKKMLHEVITGYTYVSENTLMLAKITPCFENGKSAIARSLENGIGFATTEVIPLRFKHTPDSEFFYYLLHSFPFKYIAESSMYGAGGQKRVSDNFVANYHFSLPPTEERLKITAFVQQQNEKFDVLMEKAQRQIGLLRERRTALISAAVTGKIDVREVALLA
jgi:type I restriction enzyme S subunit